MKSCSWTPRFATTRRCVNSITSPNVRVVLIDGSRDGLQQIADALAGETNVDAIHLISRGRAGALELGGSVYSAASLERHQDSLAGIGRALRPTRTSFSTAAISGRAMVARPSSRGLPPPPAPMWPPPPTRPAPRSWGGTGSSRPAPENETEQFAAAAELSGYTSLLALPVLDLNGAANFVVSDAFDTATYTGGSGGWSGGWVEFDASPSRFVAGSGDGDNNPLTGNVLHGSVGGLGAGNQIVIVGHSSQFNDSIQRSVNLLPYTSATLTFDWQLVNVEQNADVVAVQISTNGGASFATIASYSRTATGSGTTSGSASLDLSSYLATNISENAVIRFAVTGGFGETNDRFYLDNVVLTASGNNYNTTFTEDGAAVAVAGPATIVSDADANQIASATVTLNNPQAGDLLSWGALPSGITATISGNTVTLTGVSTYANYATALVHGLEHVGCAQHRSGAHRDHAGHGHQRGASPTATTYIKVVATDDPMNATPDTFATVQNAAVSGNVLADNGAGPDTDPDGTLRVSPTLVSNPTSGAVTIATNGSFTYTPNAGFTGSDTFQYQLISDARVRGSTTSIGTSPGRQQPLRRFPRRRTDSQRHGHIIRCGCHRPRARQHHAQQLHHPLHHER